MRSRDVSVVSVCVAWIRHFLLLPVAFPSFGGFGRVFCPAVLLAGVASITLGSDPISSVHVGLHQMYSRMESPGQLRAGQAPAPWPGL